MVSPWETFSSVVALDLSCGILFSSPMQGDCYHYILQNFCIKLKCKWKQIFSPSWPANSCCLVLASSKCFVEVSPFWYWSQPRAGFFFGGESSSICWKLHFKSQVSVLWCSVLLLTVTLCISSGTVLIPISTTGEPGWFKGSKSN